MGNNPLILLHSSTVEPELLEELSLSVSNAGFELRLFVDLDEMMEELDAGTVSPVPEVILIGPDLDHPLPIARELTGTFPTTRILILAALHSERLRRKVAPMYPRWALLDYRDPEFSRKLREMVFTSTPMAGQGRREGTSLVSDRYLANLLAYALDGIISTDDEGTILTWNRGAEKLFGIPPERALGMKLEEAAGGGWGSEIRTLVSNVRHGTPVERHELAIERRSDRLPLQIEVSIARVLEDSGTPIGISVVARDISDRKAAQEEQLRLARQMELLLQSTGEGIFGLSADGTIIFANRAAASMLGYEPEELLGLPAHPTLHHSYADGTEYPAERCPILDTCSNGGTRRSDQEVFWRRNGTPFPVEYSSFPTMSEGNVTGAVVIFDDVTERRQTRAELRRSREEIEVILSGVADGITAQDTSGALIYANDAAARLSGFTTADEMLATPVSEIMKKFVVTDEAGAPIPLEEFPGRLALQGHGGSEKVVGFRILETGEHRWAVVKAAPVFDENGKVRFAVNIFRDVTERRIGESRLTFLARASEVLASSLDYEATLASVARLAVPDIADWSSVDMIAEDGSVQQLAVAHVDPAKVEWAHELRRTNPPDMSAPTGLPHVLRTGTSEFYPVITNEMIEAATQNKEELEIIRKVGFSSLLIVPLTVRERTIGAITLVMAESERHYTEADLALAEDLARRAAVAIDNAWLHHTVREQREWLEVTLASIGDAVIATDTAGRVTFMNEVAEQLTGWPETEAAGRDLLEVFNIVNEQSRQPVENPVEKVLRSGQIVGLANHTVLIARDGREVPIDDSAAPILNEEGKLLGVVMVFHDITERRRAERDRAELLEREQQARTDAEASENRYRTLAETMPQIVWATYPDGSTIYRNQQWYNYTGLSSEGSDGSSIDDVIHPEDFPAMIEAWQGAVEARRPYQWEARFRRHDGIYRWFLIRAMPVLSPDGEILQWIGTSTDIDDQKRAEDKLLFLAEASGILASELDYEHALSQVARLMIPRMADWCSVTLRPPDGDLSDGPLLPLVVAHSLPEKEELAWELHRSDSPSPERGGIGAVLAYGHPEFYPEITDEMLEAAATSQEQFELWLQLGLRSMIVVPLIVQGETIGAIALAMAESERRYTPADLALAEDLARRASVAIDNARLYRLLQEELGERTRAERDLRVSEMRFRMMIEQSPLSIQIFSREGDILQANSAWEALWGTSREELAGYNIRHDPQLAAKGVGPYIERGFAGEAVALPPVRYDPAEIGRPGRPRWVRAFFYPVQDENGNVTEAVLILEDITERRMAEEALLESEERFRTMADSAPVLIWMADTDGLYNYFNAAWLDFTGREFEAELGRGWCERVHPDDLDVCMSAYQDAFDARVEFQVEYRMLRHDGEYRWMLNTGVPRLGHEGKFAGYIGSCIDITDRKHAEIELQKAKEAAEAASQAKDQFLAVLSHELRTPLTPVLTLTQALREEDLPEHIRPLVEIIDRNVELEARLIDDLLDLTRIEKGKLQLNIELANAHALLTNVLDIYRSDILGKGLELTVDLGAADHFVRADPARLQQIFWNLVKNAVKFTPAGGSIFIRSFNTPQRDLMVEVIDTGIGIDPELLPQIFAAFEQGDKKITRQFGGLGLGLSISKALVDMHGGELTAYSEGKNRGAIFTVRLGTVQPGRTGRTDHAPQTGGAGQGHTRRILLVDDHEDTSRVMKILLERQGYEVTTASTMRSGVAAAMSGGFDLMISDIGLPDGSGLELMSILTANGVPLKAIALSGFGMEEDIRRSKEVGFAEHLTKPVSFQKLQEMIDRLIAS